MKLGAVLADYRWANRLSLTEFAREIGISKSLLHRVEHGENCDAQALTIILGWLFAESKTNARRQKPYPQEKP